MQYLSLWGWLSSFNMLLFACIHFPADGITWRPIIWEYFSGETPSLAVEPVVTLCHYAFSMLTELSRSHTADHFLYQTLPQKTNTLCPQSPLEGCSGRWGTAATARSLPGTTRKCPKQSLWGTATHLHIPSHENSNRRSGLCPDTYPARCFLTGPGASACGSVCRAWLLLPVTC